jgi:antitoxin component of MazEF toxin-antitoxin module
MINKDNFLGKIKEIGNSKYILIPFWYAKFFDLEESDEVIVNIKKQNENKF